MHSFRKVLQQTLFHARTLPAAALTLSELFKLIPDRLYDEGQAVELRHELQALEDAKEERKSFELDVFDSV